MDTKIDAFDLANRMRNHAKESSMFIFNVMKGATTAMAGYALITIIFGMASGHRWEFGLRIPFWIVSILCATLTLNATNVFSNVLVYQPTLRDTLIPIAKTQAEMLLFSILADQNPSPLWRHWILVYAIWSLICHLKLRHITSHMKEEDYPENLRGMITKIKDQTEKLDKRASGISAIAAAGLWAWLNFSQSIPFIHHLTPAWLLNPDWQALVAFPALFTMVKAMETAEKGRRIIYETVESIQETTMQKSA